MAQVSLGEPFIGLSVTARGFAAFPADLGHVLAIFRDRLPAFSPDFRHMLAVARYGQPTFARDFLPGL